MTEERFYTINLRKGVMKVTRDKKSKKSINFIRNFLKKHMKAEKVKIDKTITERVWESGDQKPPGKIRVRAVKDDEGVVNVELWEPKETETGTTSKEIT